MSFEERARAIRIRIDPFDLNDEQATRIIWAQSGARWHHTDELATAPSWSRIQLAIALTEPDAAIVEAKRQIDESQARQRAHLSAQQSDLRQALWMAVALVVLALWVWLLALLPLHWR